METNYDINANLDFLLNHNLSTDVENNIELQDKILDSDNFNTTFKYIEDSLNFLYEKNRVLQDVITYTKTFLENEINTNISDCKILLQSIEKDRDLIKDKTYINYSVPFYFSLSNIIDRNNLNIPAMSVYDGRLINSDVIINSYSIDSFYTKRSSSCIFNNENNYLNSKQYRSLYVYDSIKSSPVEETIYLNFTKAIKINKINFSLSNCSIKSVKLNLENNTSIYIDTDKLDLFDEQAVTSIEVNVSCTNYMISQVKYSDVTSNNLSAIINNINTDENLYVNNKKYYYYLFGVDNIDIQYVKQNTTCGFYSQDIYIGDLNSNEHLTLYAEDSIERGSVEYYIINGTETIPVLPENQTSVVDEKIFYKTPTRFAIDNNYPVTIKKNGEVSNLSLYDVLNIKDNNLYTISYTPVINSIDGLYNKSIKVKAIIRSYNEIHKNFIKTIKIKKYGGNNLWTV